MKIGIDIRSLLERERSGVGEYTYNLLNALFYIDPVRSSGQKNFSENFSVLNKEFNQNSGAVSEKNSWKREQTSDGVDKENQYFLFYNSWKNIDGLLPEEWKNLPNVRFCGFGWPNKLLNFCFKFLKWPKMDLMIKDKKQKTEEGIDVFFIPNLNFISLSRGVKKIVTVHDLSFVRYPEFFSRKRRLWHWFVNPKKLIRGADKIIAVSENTKKDLVELYKVAQEKVEVIYSGVNLPTTEGDTEAVKKKYNLPDNFILFLGTLEPRKNIEGLIHAFEILKQNYKLQITSYKLVIVGPRGWGYKNILKKIKKSPVRDDIKLIDYIAPEEKFVFYKLARIFVYPSFYEGFGFPPLEAAAVGTPVIIGHTSSFPEVMGGTAVMVDPHNPSLLAKTMEECLNDEALRDYLIKKAKRRTEEFSWERCAENIFKIITS